MDDFEDKYYAAGNQAKAELKRGNVEFNSNKGKGRDERHNHNQVGVSKNNHPTVKPTDLMLYLIRLITPKGGTTLDPFMGSGSTGKAAVRGGFDFVGVEMDKDYMEIAEARIQYEIDNPYNEEKGERIKINKNQYFIYSKIFFSSGDIGIYNAYWNRPAPWKISVYCSEVQRTLVKCSTL